MFLGLFLALLGAFWVYPVMEWQTIGHILVISGCFISGATADRVLINYAEIKAARRRVQANAGGNGHR